MQVKRNKTLSTEIGNIKYISVIKYDIDDKLKESKMYDNISYALSMIKANNISNYVLNVKTILKDFKLNTLEIILTNGNTSISINHVDNILKDYRYTNESLDVSYNFGKINFMLNDDIDENTKIKYSMILSEQLDIISSLKELKPLSLDVDSKIMCILYKKFYGKNPDLLNKNTYIEFQNMFSIMYSLGFNLSDEIKFLIYPQKTVPWSIELDKKLSMLSSFGNINVDELDCNIKKEVLNRVEVVGNAVNEFIEKYRFIHNPVSKISYILYNLRNIEFEDASQILISSYLNINSNLTGSVLTLKKNISKELKKNN